MEEMITSFSPLPAVRDFTILSFVLLPSLYSCHSPFFSHREIPDLQPASERFSPPPNVINGPPRRDFPLLKARSLLGFPLRIAAPRLLGTRILFFVARCSLRTKYRPSSPSEELDLLISLGAPPRQAALLSSLSLAAPSPSSGSTISAYRR